MRQLEVLVCYQLKHFRQPRIIYLVEALLTYPNEWLVVCVDPDVVGSVGEVFRVDERVDDRCHLDLAHGPALLGVSEARASTVEDVLVAVTLVWLGEDVAQAGCLGGVAVDVDWKS